MGHLLFNLYINDLFHPFNDVDICNYADDNTIHAFDTSLCSLMANIEGGAAKAMSGLGMQMPSAC